MVGFGVLWVLVIGGFVFFVVFDGLGCGVVLFGVVLIGFGVAVFGVVLADCQFGFGLRACGVVWLCII